MTQPRIALQSWQLPGLKGIGSGEEEECPKGSEKSCRNLGGFGVGVNPSLVHGPLMPLKTRSLEWDTQVRLCLWGGAALGGPCSPRAESRDILPRLSLTAGVRMEAAVLAHTFCFLMRRVV
uniref:Uncharacterized protein n=1 Tax=Eutreptiella gymnastica TaxID=73025 RepID=A0A7S4CTZ1_9EUGL